MRCNLHLHVIHVSGIRMQYQGTDGLSRGVLTEGVMQGHTLLSFVPLHVSASEREPNLRLWVVSWLGNEEPFLWLDPLGWYTKAHAPGRFVWDPPPAAVDAALEQLAMAQHKHPYAEHVILIPRLMTSRWRKKAGKIFYLLITVPLGSDAWPETHLEPLTLGIAFPLVCSSPWKLRGTPLLDSV